MIKLQSRLYNYGAGGCQMNFEREEIINRTNKDNVKNNLTDIQKYVYEFMSSNIVGNLQEVADAVRLSLGGVKKICAKL